MSFSWRPSDASTPWFVGSLFLAVGLLIGWWLPGWAEALDARRLVDPGRHALRTPVFRVLGFTFSALGASIIGLAIHARPWSSDDPADRSRRMRRASYLGGVLGALAFGVPATLVLPTWALLYLRNPGEALPPDWGGTALEFALLCGAFSVLGITTLIGLRTVARRSKDRPRKTR